MGRSLILLSNDDGIEAKGLRSLIDFLRDDYDLFVVVPDGQRSAMSCCVTSFGEIIVSRVLSSQGLTMYTCSGTPCDCVKLGLSVLMERQPDLVVGGINHGNNASLNEVYSGTMGVAREGALHGLPAVAFSLCNHDENADFSPLAPYIKNIVKGICERGLPKGSCLNVNFPSAPSFRGVRVCRAGRSKWINEFSETRQLSPLVRGYQLGGENIDVEPDSTDTDSWALAHGYVAITPLGWDTTDYKLKERLEKEVK